MPASFFQSTHFAHLHALLPLSFPTRIAPTSFISTSLDLSPFLSATHLQKLPPTLSPAAFFGNQDSSSDPQHDFDENDSDGSFQNSDLQAQIPSSDLVDVSIETIGKNQRLITVAIPIEAPLEAVWNVLTDYESLSEFLPGLSVCDLQDRWENGARLFQIGEQNLAMGLKFQARGVIDVHEHPLEILPHGIRRDLDFEMIEGDFQIFKGTWRMEQASLETSTKAVKGSAFQTNLSYILYVKPKLWLPVALVEGRLSKEIQSNLVCVRDQVLRCHGSLQDID